ncbi:MAG: DUF4330 domain-containing protein [Actinomycetota bacterium]|jgi:hypothetical protein|nr:DUF4330 domain-containing protein [Actinomycetota bacterium]
MNRLVPKYHVLALMLLLAVMPLAGCSDAPASDDGGPSGEQTVEVALLIRGALPEVASSFSQGQTVRVKDTGTVVGDIVNVERGAAVLPVPTAEGELNAAESPVFEDVVLTIQGRAVVTDTGYSFGGANLYINNDIKYLTQVTVFAGIITSIEIVEQ